MSLEFRCRDVGVICRGKVSADTPEELVRKIAQHADEAHGVPEVDATLVEYAKTVVTEKASSGRDR